MYTLCDGSWEKTHYFLLLKKYSFDIYIYIYIYY